MPMDYTLRSQVFAVFVEQLDADPDELGVNTDLDIFEMDDLEEREVAEAISEQFLIDFTPDHLDECDTLGDVVRIVAHKAGN